MSNHAHAINSGSGYRSWLMNKLKMGMTWPDYAKSLATPFNLLAFAILAASAPVFAMRYTQGLSTVIDGSHEYPWGLLLSWGIFAGEPLFACGFLVATAYYVFGFKEFRPMVRLGVVGGMLGYMFAASYLLIDLGRPWRLYFPMAINFGPSSILFVVAWHVCLYVNVQLLEFSPAIFEWLGSKRVHKWAVSGTVGLVVLGTILTTIHQSALGAMYLITPGKLHPLWYSPNLPIYFLSSAIYAAAAFLVVMSGFFAKYFRNRCDEAFLASLHSNTIMLGKVMVVAMYAYFALKVLGVAQENNWALLPTAYGKWFLVEVLGFVLAPALLITAAIRSNSSFAVQMGSIWAIAGILLNRVNVNLIAYNWFMPDHIHHITPPWTETIMIAAMVTLHVLVLRWLVNRFPILGEDPAYKGSH